MLKIENITKSYKKGIKVIENINLEIKEGDIFIDGKSILL